MKHAILLLLLSASVRVFSQGNAFDGSELVANGTYRTVKIWVNDSLIFVAPGTYLSDISPSSPQDFIKLNSENFVIQKKNIFEIYHSLKKNPEPGKDASGGSIAILSIPAAFNKTERRELTLASGANEQAFMDLLFKR